MKSNAPSVVKPSNRKGRGSPYQFAARGLLFAASLGGLILSSSCNSKKTNRLDADVPQEERVPSDIAIPEQPKPQIPPAEEIPPQPDPEQLHQQALEEQKRQDDEKRAIREAARQAAVGRTMDRLETIDGKLYEQVTIREVSAVGISIRHDSGSGRIPFEKLPLAMQREFHFDPAEKEQAVRQEREMHARHESALAESHEPPIRQAPNPLQADDPPDKPASPPKGNITSRVVGYKNNYKEVEFACITNCDATLTVNGAVRYPPTYVVTFKVEKGSASSHTVLVRNTYSAELRNAESRILDRESNLKKSGLGSTKLNN